MLLPLTFAQRLPESKGDLNSWGTILNQFLLVSLSPNGTLNVTSQNITAQGINASSFIQLQENGTLLFPNNVILSPMIISLDAGKLTNLLSLNNQIILSSSNITGTFGNTSLTDLDASKLTNIGFLNNKIILDYSNLTNTPAIPNQNGVTIPEANVTNLISDLAGKQPLLNGITVPASNITAGTFGTGNYVFPSNLTVLETLNVTAPVPMNSPIASFVDTNSGRGLIFIANNNGLDFQLTSPGNNLQFGSGNTNIVLMYNDYIDFNIVNGLPRGRWTGTGRLGIATNDPQTLLQIINGTGIYDGTQPLVDPFDVSNKAGQSMFRVTKDGNVGIGTATPTQKLDVNGSVVVNNSVFFVNADTGNVGIGTANPTAGLQIATDGDASTPSVLLNGTWFSGGTATTTKPQLLIEQSGTTSTGWSLGGTGLGVNAPSGLGLTGSVFDFQQNGVSYLRMRGVDGSMSSSTGYIAFVSRVYTNSGIDAGDGSKIRLSSGSVLGWSSAVFEPTDPDTGLSRLSAGTLALGTGTANNYSGTMIAGSIGIGTVSPTQTLTVVGDANVTGTLYVGAQSFTNIDAAGNTIIGRNLTVSNNVLFVDNNTGRVGIGTTSPGAGLDVVPANDRIGLLVKGANNTLFPSSGTTAYWKFDESSGGTASDSTGNSNTGTWLGTLGSQWTTGKLNNAGSFNGIDNYVNTSFTPSSTFSISLWFKADTTNDFTQSNRGLFSTYAGSLYNGMYVAGAGTANTLRLFRDGNSVFNINYSFDINTWYNLVITSGSNTITVYVNGVQINQTTGTTNHADALVIGKSRFNTNYWQGAIDEVSIWNRVLSLSEVSNLYNSGSGLQFSLGYDIQKWADASGSFVANINYAGYMGVGTVNPLNRLDVSGSAALGTYAGSTVAPGNGLIVSGNVGIGTATPSQKLDVNGTISGLMDASNITSGTISDARLSSSVSLLGQSIESGEIASLDASKLTNIAFLNSGITLAAENITAGTFGAGNYYFLNNVSITNNLSVGSTFTAGGLFTNQTRTGIGTTNPVTQFHVSYDGYALNSSLITSDPIILSAQNYAPGFSIVVASNQPGQRGVFKAVKANGTLMSPTAPATNDDILTFLAAIYDGNITQATAGVFFKVDGSVSPNIAPARISFVTSNTTAAARTEKMVIKSNGNVGIGTSTPQSILDVNGTTNITGNLYASGNVGIGTTSPTGTLSVNSSNALGSLRVYNVTGSEHLFVNGSTGNVGIGTSSPGETLDIVGAMHLTPQASPPTSADSGDMYMDSTPNPDELCVYDGTSWQALITGTDSNCA